MIIIPRWHETDREHIIIKDNREPLVSLSQAESDRIVYEPAYYNNGIPGATDVCYVRKSVLEKLNEALTLLPDGYGFKIFDAWRPFQVQKFLFDKEVERIMSCSGADTETAIKQAKRFVSFPTKNPDRPFVHSTGGAVDLTLIDKDNNELDMGTAFDDFTSLAFTYSFEKSDNEEVKNNRRLLYKALTGVGFTNYPSEWWHYDYGDSFWAAESNISEALYGGIYEICD